MLGVKMCNLKFSFYGKKIQLNIMGLYLRKLFHCKKLS